MLKVYTSYNCTSCKKALNWLREKGIGYEEYNFFSKDLTKDELLYMLQHTENGFDDIISERSKVYQLHKDSIYDLKTQDLIDFIINHPSILKRPILIDDVTKSIIVGFNDYEIELLL